MRQRGVSFLEVIVVVAILLIASSFVSPSITEWRGKRSLEADYLALLSNIDFIKTRVRTINGTGVLICNPNSVLTYQISANPQSTALAVSSNFASNILEDPSAKDINFNILSGGSTVASTICTVGRGVFSSNGLTGVEGAGGAIAIELSRGGNLANLGGYRIVLTQTTGFIQKYKWNQASNAWIEQD